MKTLKEYNLKLNEKEDSEPPFMLILKRKAIRLFPNNQKVALYYNEKLNRFFSIPYNSDMSMSEEVNLLSMVVENLNDNNREKFIELVEEDYDSAITFAKEMKQK